MGCEEREQVSCRRNRSYPSSRPYHPEKPPSIQCGILLVPDSSKCLSKITLAATVIDGSPKSSEMHSRRWSSRSPEMTLCLGRNRALLFCGWHVWDRRSQRARSSLVHNDFVDHMTGMDLWHADGIGIDKLRISQPLDNT
jgi:hypothetical protein